MLVRLVVPSIVVPRLSRGPLELRRRHWPDSLRSDFGGRGRQVFGESLRQQVRPREREQPFRAVRRALFLRRAVQNEFGKSGKSFSSVSATNRFSNQAPKIVNPCTGRYLGRLSANEFAPESTANHFGTHGSPFSTNSINNQFGPYGSPYSPASVANPFAASGSRARSAVGGGLDASIPLSVRTPPAEPFNPLRALESMERIRAARLENQRRELEIAQSRQSLVGPSLPERVVPHPQGKVTSTFSPPARSPAPVVGAVAVRPQPQASQLGYAGNLAVRSSNPAFPQFRPMLPSVDGLTESQVVASLGNPSYTQVRSRGALKIWYHATPQGTAAVFLNRGVASLNDPRKRPSSASVSHVAAMTACHSTAARTVKTLFADVPVFVAPQILPRALTTLERGVILPVRERFGSWLLISFEDRRWGTRVGYVTLL